MRRYIISAVLLLVFGLLAGCGQKGPLHLPTKKAVAPASASSAPAAATSIAKPAEPATAATPASSSSAGG